MATPALYSRRMILSEKSATFRDHALARSIGPIAGVAKPWNDVGVVVEALIDRGGPDRHVRMNPAQPLDRRRNGNQAHEADVAGAAFLEPVDRRDRRVARGNDRGDDDDLAFRHVRRR